MAAALSKLVSLSYLDNIKGKVSPIFTPLMPSEPVLAAQGSPSIGGMHPADNGSTESHASIATDDTAAVAQSVDKVQSSSTLVCCTCRLI